MLHASAEQRLAHSGRFLLFQNGCWTFAAAGYPASGSREREETDSMGHLFGHDIAMPGGRLDARKRGSFLSIGRFSVIALGLAVALVLPISRAAGQATSPAPGGESEVQLLQPSGPGQAAPPVTVTLKDALDRARKLDPTLLGAISDAKSAHEDRIQARNAMLPTITGTSQYLGTQGNGGIKFRRKIRDKRRNSRLPRLGRPASGPLARRPHGNGSTPAPKQPRPWPTPRQKLRAAGWP